MASLDHLQSQQLLAGCRNVQANRSHEKFCFELFRRAIVEQSQGCWAALYEQYVKLVYSWTIAYAKSQATIGSSTLEDLVQDTFTAFWQSYSPTHLAKATSLGSVLSYLNSCAWSSVQHAVRRVQAPQDEQDLETAEVALSATVTTSPEQIVLTTMVAEQLWQAIEASCKGASEKRIARLRFVEGMKPKEILARCPDLAPNEYEISKILRNIKDRLNRNLYLQEVQKDRVL
ncbi:MAG: sigma-70 family RNA polymerase sigma factor [Caldilineaceae bacterium]